jgi:hypothetical protein
LPLNTPTRDLLRNLFILDFEKMMDWQFIQVYKKTQSLLTKGVKEAGKTVDRVEEKYV